jgi:hypothetical protein
MGGDRPRHLLYGVGPFVYQAASIENSKLAAARSAGMGGRASPRAVMSFCCVGHIFPLDLRIHAGSATNPAAAGRGSDVANVGKAGPTYTKAMSDRQRSLPNTGRAAGVMPCKRQCRINMRRALAFLVLNSSFPIFRLSRLRSTLVYPTDQRSTVGT